jgi:hypothetical protein
MAERRMFTQKITEADSFTALPPTTQCLYFHLCMNADDDGFSNKIRQAMFNAHADQNDFEMLVQKRFILPFDSGVIVIKHWRMHNLIRSDRYHETDYLEEKATLLLKDNGVYTDALPVGMTIDNQVSTTGMTIDNQVSTEDRLGKDRLGKDREVINYQQIADMYNDTCVSFPRLTTLSDARKKAIRARLNTYTIDDFALMFKKAEASTFLKGGNDRNWRATFDWMIKDSNMAKILDGNYDNKKSGAKSNNSFNNFTQNTYDFDDLEKQLLDN